MLTSVLFDLNYKATDAVVVNQGGTSSGKTFAILQVLFCLACETGGLVITVCGQDMPNLKAGAVRDALAIYNSSLPLNAAVKMYNKSDRFFEFINGSIIEFRSYDSAQDAKSGKRDYLFVNEANGISWDVYNELALRTKKRVFLDYNPNIEFWVHNKLLGRDGVQLIISDHRHNPFIEDSVRQKIEALRHIDEGLWKVYARGLTGKISGLVFNNWRVCEAIPHNARLIATGLDFGFTNDPTACLQVYRQNGELWVHELFYEPALTNTDIAAKLKQYGLNFNHEVVADSAEPKSIEELRRMGWLISAAKKGPDSVANSIDILQRYKINITRASTNLRNELGRYKWKTDKAGRSVNQPVDAWNHLVDALRYVALNKLGVNTNGAVRSKLPVRNTSTGTNPLLAGIL
ncbi:PBSX family phage terminase large subunit [Mucilaginibacter defluvii]|uniref:PBSX family phage terminase large subunit n=1 Tax=Mucilaginibacter defluvii TaxID=1196019 RepID=A0ABP9FKY2_9SPHI